MLTKNIFNKKLFLTLLLTLSVMFIVTSCGSSSTEETAPDVTDTAQTEDVDTDEPVSVSLVVEGGLGDRSFYDSSYSGLERAINELGIKGYVLECKSDPSIFNDQLVQAANNSELVFVVGFGFYDAIQEVAPAFPDVQFVYIDSIIEDVPNITSVVYKENEGSFLAGAVAALQTETGVIGFVGGDDVPVIRNFEIGYIEGAQYINPDIQIESIFVGDYEDPAKGKEAGLALYENGVDIIFSVAGNTGNGVFEAGAETGNYVIGVDSDQRYINPDVIIASMIKAVGTSVFDSIQKYIDGTLEYGSVYVYGLQEGGVDIAYGTEDMPQIVSEENKAIVQELKDDIISGNIVVSEYK